MPFGFITAIGVALAIGWFEPFRNAGKGYQSQLPDREHWRFVERWQTFSESGYSALQWWDDKPFQASTPYTIRRVFQTARWERADIQPHSFSLGGPNGGISMVEWGWPCRCIWGVAEWYHPRTSFSNPPTHLWGLYVYFRQIDPSTSYTREVPFAPIPAGLIVDTLVWATPWWLALFGMRRIRRWNRLRRDHCPHCDYNLAGLAADSPCPECGQTIMRNVRKEHDRQAPQDCRSPMTSR
jgi:hypothetical protein